MDDVNQLYRTYGPTVLRRARAILGDNELARDVLQDVFVLALEEGSRFRGEASPMTWMYRITTNLCLNRMRDSSRRARILAERFDATTQTFDEASPEARMTLASILGQVPERLRAIAVYHFVDQMSHEEIASLVGTSRRTVGNRLEEFRRRARAAAEPLSEVSG